MNERFDQLRLLEAIFFGSAKPLKPDQLKRHLPEGADINGLINELQALYANRGVNLVQIADCWAFRTATDIAPYMKIEATAVKKLTRAAVETLAIVAYHQPVTRGEIEEIRGVALSKGTLDTLLEAGWIKLKGRRKTPGRPVTWGTTDSFLDHFGLDTVDSLPGIEELKAAGLLDSRPAITALGGRGVLLASSEDAEDTGDEEEEDLEEAEELLPENFGEPLSAVEMPVEQDEAGNEETEEDKSAQALDAALEQIGDDVRAAAQTEDEKSVSSG